MFHLLYAELPGPGEYRLPSDFGHYVSKSFLDSREEARAVSDRPDYQRNKMSLIQREINHRNYRSKFQTQCTSSIAASDLGEVPLPRQRSSALLVRKKA